MMLVHIHRYAWSAAAFAVAFALELSGVFHVGAVGIFVPFIFILLAGFFSARWFAGFLALSMLALSFFMAPFWILDIGVVAIMALLLLIIAPFLSGNRFPDFLILLSIGTIAMVVGGAWFHGGVSWGTALLALVLNVVIGAGGYMLIERGVKRSPSFIS